MICAVLCVNAMEIPTLLVTESCHAWDQETDAQGAIWRDCEHMTTRGTYCADHAESLLGLRVGPSNIPGAGLGLFTTRDILAHRVIDEYKGEILSADDYRNHPSDYAVAISLGRVIDSYRSTDCYARYANQGNRRTINTWLISERKFGRDYARPRYNTGSGAVVFLVSKKRIPAGTELLTDYGNGYWQGR